LDTARTREVYERLAHPENALGASQGKARHRPSNRVLAHVVDVVPSAGDGDGRVGQCAGQDGREAIRIGEVSVDDVRGETLGLEPSTLREHRRRQEDPIEGLGDHRHR
jgi:hypothetical protein